MKYLKSLLPIFLVTIINYLVVVVFTSIYIVLTNNQNPSGNQTYINLVLLLTIISSLIIIKIFKKKYNIETKKVETNKSLYILLLGISISILLNIIINYLTNPLPSNVNILIILETGLIGPILEEFMFRGYLFNNLKTYNKETTAFIISLLTFSLLHGNILNIIYALIIGFITLKIYIKTNNLTYSIIFHIGANLSITILNNLILKITPISIVIVLLSIIILIYTIIKTKSILK